MKISLKSCKFVATLPYKIYKTHAAMTLLKKSLGEFYVCYQHGQKTFHKEILALVYRKSVLRLFAVVIAIIYLI